ncbi:MAG TPA: VCBS repeat-containing protein, partial [Taishania sp.]|nr:VCBS repeat-containing protein [Taishania sp.]
MIRFNTILANTTKVAFSSLVMLGSAASFAQTMEFTLDANNVFPTLSNGAIKFGDIDGDGDLDIFMSGKNGYDYYSQIYVNNDGVFTLQTGTTITPLANSSAQFIDVENDDDLDLIVAGRGEDGVVTELYLNDGQGNFTLSTANTFTKMEYGFILVADVNDDGFSDIFVAGSNGISGKSNLYINDGTGVFTAATTSIPNLGEESFGDFADVDNDGDIDLFISGRDNSFSIVTQLYKNDGHGNFTLEQGTNFRSIMYGDAKFADITGDGWVDLVTSGKNDDFANEKNIYFNQGDGTFLLNGNSSITSAANGKIEFLDADRDGDLDLLLTGESGGNMLATIYANQNGEGIFTVNDAYNLTGVSEGAVAVGDVNGDGSADILISGIQTNSANFSGLYINETCFDSFLDQETLADINANCAVESVTPPTATTCNGTINGTTSTTFPITTPGTTVIAWSFDDGNGFTAVLEQRVIIALINANVVLTGTTLEVAADPATHTFQWINCAD